VASLVELLPICKRFDSIVTELTNILGTLDAKPGVMYSALLAMVGVFTHKKCQSKIPTEVLEPAIACARGFFAHARVAIRTTAGRAVACGYACMIDESGDGKRLNSSAVAILTGDHSAEGVIEQYDSGALAFACAMVQGSVALVQEDTVGALLERLEEGLDSDNLAVREVRCSVYVYVCACVFGEGVAFACVSTMFIHKHWPPHLTTLHCTIPTQTSMELFASCFAEGGLDQTDESVAMALVQLAPSVAQVRMRVSVSVCACVCVCVCWVEVLCQPSFDYDDDITTIYTSQYLKSVASDVRELAATEIQIAFAGKPAAVLKQGRSCVCVCDFVCIYVGESFLYVHLYPLHYTTLHAELYSSTLHAPQWPPKLSAPHSPSYLGRKHKPSASCSTHCMC
jgi:hypothetical protein